MSKKRSDLLEHFYNKQIVRYGLKDWKLEEELYYLSYTQYICNIECWQRQKG